MKKYIMPLLALALVAGGAQAKSFKRGVSENQFSIAGQMNPLAPGVSWYYNWGNTPGKGYQNQVIDFSGFDFIPMCWNASYSADNIREYVKAHPECCYLLGFNEPNFTAQANMTPQRAAEEWPKVKALADELGLELVAPAMNYSPNAPYQDPTKWFDEFVALVGSDAFDYVAVHNYGGLGVMKTLAGTFHEKYGKPVWVTEFCYWPNEGVANSRVEPSAQIASMIESVEWLEKTDWIYRYAWFKAVGDHENTATKNSPCYGLIISENGVGEKQLSPQGMVYTYMSEFDPDVWHVAGETIPATEYISCNATSIAPGKRDDAPLPIEISQFNSGAYLDYQLDVPQDDTYTLTLTVTGVGEPTRFDPDMSILLVEADGTATTLHQGGSFGLPGNESDYITHSFTIDLAAGHRTVRLLDNNPYRPSGIRISSLSFNALSGVSDVAIDADADTDSTLYSIDGRVMPQTKPAPGLYIRGGKKIIVH